MKARLCDQCEAIIKGDVDLTAEFGNDDGKIEIQLLEEADWCEACARKAKAALSMELWSTHKQPRKVGKNNGQL